jgi:protoporphyrin/coproporphyrin ferrochelatase
MLEHTGVVLVNLGSPSVLQVSAIRSFLNEFLSDLRVISIPKWIWQPILKGIILPVRSRKLVDNYAKIWTSEGSPLLSIGHAQATKLERALIQAGGLSVKVKFACCYGEPSIESVCDELLSKGIKHLVFLPLYPQHSETTTGVALHRILNILSPCQGGCAFKCRLPKRCRRERALDPDHISFIKSYAKNPFYIKMIVQSITSHFKTHGMPEHLVISFHGLPKRCIDRGDPYAQQCKQTFDLIQSELKLPEQFLKMSFQSRFGYETWLMPSTQTVLEEYAVSGVKRIAVVCPGFAADCLETLEEVSVQYADHFKQAGGEIFHYIPALNDSEPGIELLSSLLGQVLA